jgi:hypothetical protein
VRPLSRCASTAAPGPRSSFAGTRLGSTGTSTARSDFVPSPHGEPPSGRTSDHHLCPDFVRPLRCRSAWLCSPRARQGHPFQPACVHVTIAQQESSLPTSRVGNAPRHHTRKRLDCLAAFLRQICVRMDRTRAAHPTRISLRPATKKASSIFHARSSAARSTAGCCVISLARCAHSNRSRAATRSTPFNPSVDHMLIFVFHSSL